jgi:hypothetical protein
MYPVTGKELRTKGKVWGEAVLHFSEVVFQDISAEFLWGHKNNTASTFYDGCVDFLMWFILN